MNRNNFLLGFVLGLTVPIFGMYLYYLLKFMSEHISVSDFLILLRNNHYMIPKVISLGLLATIPLITYYKNRRHYTTLNGVFLAIALYAAIAVMYKLNIF